MSSPVAKRLISFSVVTIVAGLFSFSPCIVHAQPWQTSVDYDKLLAEYGTVEDGTGISVSIVEADINADMALYQYLPNPADPGLAGKNIIDGSGLNNSGFSGHATGVARRFTGDLSIAQGEADLTGFDANTYINQTLGFATGLDPDVQTSVVQNHSWIGGFGVPVADVENILQRLDFTINRDNMSVVVGLANNTNPQPRLLGQAYNVIAVGRTDGTHSSGTTTLYGAGRIKPDIVTDEPVTSWSTPRTGSVLAVLHEKANVEGNADARNSEMMKAIVMAGATKSEFPGWSRTTTSPLDDTFGAGELNIYNSYKIVEAGETDGSMAVPPGATVDVVGYDFGESIDPGNPLYYNFEVDTGFTLEDLSISLNWNIDVTDTDASGIFSPMTDLADMTLRLYDSTGAPLGTLLDSSESPVDNVEYIFQSSLAAGLYTIEVSTDRTHDFGLAWFGTVVPEPNSLLLLVVGSVLCTRTRRRHG